MSLEHIQAGVFSFGKNLIRAEVFSKDPLPDNIDFDKQLEPISVVANAMHDKVSKLVNKPNEVELELALKFGVEGGVIVAKGSAEVAFSVKLTWKDKEEK